MAVVSLAASLVVPSFAAILMEGHKQSQAESVTVVDQVAAAGCSNYSAMAFEEVEEGGLEDVAVMAEMEGEEEEPVYTVLVVVYP